MPSGDLGELASLSNEPSWMTIEDPSTGTAMENEFGVVRFLVMGQDSDTFLKTDREIQNKRLRQNMQRRKGRGIDAVGSPEQWDEDETEKLTACIVNFENVVINGQKVEYSKEAAKQLVKIPAVRRQLADFIMDSANFFKKSS